MLNTQLSKVYFEEALKEAAQTRADRKAKSKNLNGLFFLLAVTSVMVWLFQSFIAG
jgi:hypothetical protein